LRASTARDGRRGGARHLPHARGKRLQHAAGLEPAQIAVVGDGAQHCVAHTRAVARQIGGQDRGRLVQRGLLEQGQQPPLGQLLGAGQQQIDWGVGNRPCPPPTGRARAPSAVLYHAPQSSSIRVDRNMLEIRFAGDPH
jgi:hypothetical protein